MSRMRRRRNRWAHKNTAMRVLIISDLHANIEALEAVKKAAGKVDRVLCAGDVVNYGPAPAECIDWLRREGAVVVCGNHDLSVAAGTDPKTAPDRQPMALATRNWTRAELREPEIDWLANLPRQKSFELGGANWLMVHATPSNPLYDYRLQPDASEKVVEELTRDLQADVMVVGHTHLPMLRTRRNLQIINPGSVGQPLDADSWAAYAIWEDGQISLHRVGYDQDRVCQQLQGLPLSRFHRDALCGLLRHGRMVGSEQPKYPNPTLKKELDAASTPSGKLVYGILSDGSAAILLGNVVLAVADANDAMLARVFYRMVRSRQSGDTPEDPQGEDVMKNDGG